MFADDGIKGSVLAFLDLEFNGDGDFGHKGFLINGTSRLAL
jgi:hypothetical protein